VTAQHESIAPLERGPTLAALLRPAVGFIRPQDVVKDSDLPVEEKRAILATWASDACAIEARPFLRRLPGAETPVPILEIMEALDRLDSGERA
jgi:hypothetical protein